MGFLEKRLGQKSFYLSNKLLILRRAFGIEVVARRTNEGTNKSTKNMSKLFSKHRKAKTTSSFSFFEQLPLFFIPVMFDLTFTNACEICNDIVICQRMEHISGYFYTLTHTLVGSFIVKSDAMPYNIREIKINGFATNSFHRKCPNEN